MVEEGIMQGMVPVRQGAVTPAIPLCQVGQSHLTLKSGNHRDRLASKLWWHLMVWP
jgi:hypothetical protein